MVWLSKFMQFLSKSTHLLFVEHTRANDKSILPIGCQILMGDQAAFALHLRDNFVGDGSLIESFGSVLSYELKRCRQN